jgi:hypothetical protein
MKELTNIQRTTQFLNKVFKAINETYFDNRLETPVITIQSSIGAYGYITVNKVWNTDGVARYELNIGAETLNRPIENVVATMIHECSHLYALLNNIKDTSNNGIYHNKKFKEIAENIGRLRIDKHDKYGWTITSPTEDTLNFCIDNNFEDIKINRQGLWLTIPGDNTTRTTTTGRPTSTRKYQCPCCKNSFRATKDLNVMCMDCNIQYELVR